jgi:hypothetical protein
MGSSNTKPLLPIQDDEESKLATILAKQDLEKSFVDVSTGTLCVLDKYEEDCIEQYRVLAKFLKEDEREYAKEVDEYRAKNNKYVITDRVILRKGEELMMRQNIVWK